MGNNGQPKDHVVYENGVKVATLRVVPDKDGNAKLQISYDRAYVVNNGKNANFYFRYGLDVNWIPNKEDLQQTWVFLARAPLLLCSANRGASPGEAAHNPLLTLWNPPVP